ncbi:hypothetical protein ACDF64_04335 [Agromyces sp. MMS24-JH15]|uniref:hypothetical protein n=1 Tax=Agromyces sp. MMS24-JH15 TaxID=3243765 RepID=UPI003747B06C
MQPTRPLDPIPGESRLGLVTTAVMFVLALVALIATSVASIFVADLGSTVLVCAILTAVALMGLGISWIQRRRYLRNRRFGRVIERDYWGGDNGTASL